MLLKVIDVEGNYLVEMPHKLTINESKALTEELRQISEKQPNPNQIILDWGKTRLVDSYSIDELVNLVRVINNPTIKILCWSICPQVQSMIAARGAKDTLKMVKGTEVIGTLESSQKTAIILKMIVISLTLITVSLLFWQWQLN